MRLGILGGGQLAQMLTLAAYPLGIHTRCIDPDPTACARNLTEVMTAEWTDETALRSFLSAVDVVTYETENIPLSCAAMVAAQRPLYPSVETLRIAQDRLHEKIFFQSLQIPTPAFRYVDSEAMLQDAVAELGLPSVLKTRRMGYDGKGQAVLKTSEDLPSAWRHLKNSALILESFINFEYEVSLIATRNQSGDVRFYPLTQNKHQNGILRWSQAPFENISLEKRAKDYANRILNALDYVGTLAIEFFYDGEQLLANEIAPRVHNSGHWTIEGAQTSQFENHLRALFQLPLGSTKTTGHSFMLNCIGEMPDMDSVLAIPGVHYHTYGKSPRPHRKLGHITLVETDVDTYSKGRQTLSAYQKIEVTRLQP